MKTSSLFRKLIGAALSFTVISHVSVLPLTLTANAQTTVQPQAVVAAADTVYIVRSGDTLSAIAKRYGTTVNALVSYNQLPNTTIFIGQRLLIPNQQPTTIRYVVQRGDTLSALSQRYGTTVAAIMQLNNLGSSVINIGQTLLIPATQTPPDNSTTRGRIQFAPGAIAATVYGTVRGTEERQYTLRALAGQTMTVNATARDAGMLIEIQGLSDGVIYKHIGEAYVGDLGSWRGVLPTTQDYLITVALGLSTGPQADYALTVTIPPLTQQPSQPLVQRLQFAPGTSGATVTGAVDGSTYVRYILGARRGQTMWANVTSDTNLMIIAPSGQLLIEPGWPVQSWSGGLPETGDYIIEITSVGLAANYRLAVTIQ